LSAGLGFILVLAAIVGGLLFLHFRRERLLFHEERMKALELGRELPDTAAIARLKAVCTDPGGVGKSESLPRTCYSTALWVAFWGFVFASQAGHGSEAIAVVIAVSAGSIGVTAVICGTILATRTRSARTSRVASKPFIESDALDVVSSRG
jgi:hypothetical protein